MLRYVSLVLLGLSLAGLGQGTHITLKSRPGTIFSIPLEFGTGSLDAGAPAWVKYEGGTLKGVAGEPGLYKFRLTEDDGTAVDVDIGVGPREEQVNGLCTLKKPFGRLLNLDEKLELGIPGGIYVDYKDETVLQYPTACKNSRGRRRMARQSHNHAHEQDTHDDDEFGQGAGSGSEEDDDEDFEDEDEDDIVDRTGHSIAVQPTPTFDFEPRLRSDLVEFGVPTPIISSTPLTLYTSTSAVEHDHHDHHDPLFPEFSQLGSGDFEITPSSPVLSFPSSTPIIEAQVPTAGPEPPVLRKQIEKLLIPAGRVFKFDISSGYFSAPNKIIYSLEPLEDEPLPDWLAIEEGALVAWPTQGQVSDYNVVLVAEDTVTHGSATAELALVVRQSQKIRNYNHEFELEFRKTDGLRSVPMYEIMEKVHEFAGGRGENDLIVSKIESESGIYKLKWTNESLLVGENLSRCPVAELQAIYSRLATASGTPRPGLTNALSPGFTPVSVGVSLPGASVCGGIKPTNISGWRPAIIPKENFQPRITHPIDNINAVTGEYLVYKVPDNFCHDVEDGETRYLQLSLLDKNSVEVGNESWLQFDQKNQEFYGLPPGVGAGLHTEEWVLKCTDSEGKSANDALELKITPHPKTDYSAEFILYFQSQSGFNAPEIRKFIETLAKALNDTMANIVIKSYQQSPPKVQVVWFNKTNPSTESELTAIRRMMFTDDGPPKNSFKELFKPAGFNLSNGQVIPKGRLIGQGTFVYEGDLGAVEPDVVTEGDVTKIGGASDEGAYLITYIIPSVLIAVMVLLAALIACLLTRKRKAIPTAADESRAFIKKGVPVIFQDELEEDKGARSRSPAILREEHPPLPPEYRRSPIEQYQPPPPMNKSTGSRGVRPNTSYRRPPPYGPT